MKENQNSGSGITRRVFAKNFAKKSIFGAVVAANATLLTGLVNADTTSDLVCTGDVCSKTSGGSIVVTSTCGTLTCRLTNVASCPAGHSC